MKLKQSTGTNEGGEEQHKLQVPYRGEGAIAHPEHQQVESKNEARNGQREHQGKTSGALSVG